MTQAQLHAALAGAAEAEYAAFSSKLLGGAQKPLLGVRLPALRRLAAQLVREKRRRGAFALHARAVF